MNTQEGKIGCGDSEACADCTVRTDAGDGTGRPPPFLTRNALGRCDFYRGPAEVRVSASKRA